MLTTKTSIRRLAVTICLLSVVAAGCATKSETKPPAAAPVQGAAAKAEVVAHRGGKPENTLTAFKTALADPDVGAIELDVQVSKDGQLFIMHDKTVDRTTDGKGEVAALTAAELKGLKTPKGGTEPVPTLDEVLALVAALPGKRVFVEIKEPTPADTPAKVLAALKQHNVADRAVVTSFDRSLVDETRRLDPKQATGFISSKAFDAAEIAFPGEYLFITYTKVFTDKIEAAHKAGKKVYVWTVNDKSSMAIYMGMGADGIVSDEYRLVAETKKGLGK
ncbi:MAG TPA: glycerophosphodiester phosphodiesterase family protein [Symbiobacteriaceae bacterium]|nr:glycerophosphodiester phosphodiesterase family protein [Symbiobacteriaceae bacterium]